MEIRVIDQAVAADDLLHHQTRVLLFQHKINDSTIQPNQEEKNKHIAKQSKDCLDSNQPIVH